jgi:carboxylate-amine ligase
MPGQPPSADALRARFDDTTEFTVGIEEELLLLDPVTLELVPRAEEVMSWLDGDQRFKFELPASQLEILTAPHATATDAADALIAARRHLAERADGRVRVAGAGVSPLGAGSGELNALPRYEDTIRDYTPVIQRQLVCALQVHIAVPGADRALAVYNHARTYLPWLAALAANAAFYEGQDTGLASVRPMLSDLLPRQGIPPPFDSWREYAEALSWGASTGALPEPGSWWWELRPHPAFGTLEFRVPDSQSTVAEAAALAALIHALVVWLARRHDAGEQLPVAAGWRLEQNRWSACRYGVEGEMVDAHTGQRRGTRECLEQLLEALEPIAVELGAAVPLEQTRAMIQANGAIGQRQAAARGDASAVAQWLVERFLEPWPG